MLVLCGLHQVLIVQVKGIRRVSVCGVVASRVDCVLPGQQHVAEEGVELDLDLLRHMLGCRGRRLQLHLVEHQAKGSSCLRRLRAVHVLDRVLVLNHARLVRQLVVEGSVLVKLLLAERTLVDHDGLSGAVVVVLRTLVLEDRLLPQLVAGHVAAIRILSCKFFD